MVSRLFQLFRNKLFRAAALDTPLSDILRQEIIKNGPITIERYMQIVLHDERYGYYRRGIPVGRDGDFSTGPEVSQMFGETIGAWCVETWKRMGSPAPFTLLELGPGRGTMLRSLLSLTSTHGDFHRAMQLRLMESNKSLRDVQQDALSAYDFEYIEGAEDIPRQPLIVIGNEFFDTFPLRQFVYRRKQWKERCVGRGMRGLKIIEQPAPATIDVCGANVINGYYREISPLSSAMVGGLSLHIAQYGGAGLLIDYGYNEPTGENTIFALRKHKHVDILSRPGETDVTADVDFGAFRRAVESGGARVYGAIEQGEFFKELGIAERAIQLKKHSPEHAEKIDHELFRLTHRSAMGEWFKVFGFCNVSLAALPGFSQEDESYSTRL